MVRFIFRLDGPVKTSSLETKQGADPWMMMDVAMTDNLRLSSQIQVLLVEISIDDNYYHSYPGNHSRSSDFLKRKEKVVNCRDLSLAYLSIEPTPLDFRSFFLFFFRTHNLNCVSHIFDRVHVAQQQYHVQR